MLKGGLWDSLLYGKDFYKAENAMDALVMDIEFSPDNIDASLDSLRCLRNGTFDSEEVYSVFQSLNERRALLSFLESRKDVLVSEVIAKWIEDHWNRGPVDKASLVNSLERVFGGAKEIAEPTQEKTAERQISTALTPVVAGDWRHRRDLGAGIFELKMETTKRIDVSTSGPELEHQLAKLGLRTNTKSAFGAFRHTLRREAGVIRGR